MDAAQWQQEFLVKPIDEIVTDTTYPKPPAAAAATEKKPRPQKEQALNCPRCNSTNTKFCYYNNYSLTQPRYFCKGCRRYWTEGGTLRNIPVGGGSRKNKRSTPPPNSSSTSSSRKLPDLVTPNSTSQNPKVIQDGHDLNLGFCFTQNMTSSISDLAQEQNIDNNTKNNTFPSSSSSNNNTSQLSNLELISGISSRGFASFMSMPDPSTVYSSGFPMQEFKPSLYFSLDGLGSHGYGYGSFQGVQENGTTSGRLLFPFENSRHVPQNTATEADQQSKVQGHSAGCWTEMLDGSGSW